MFDIFSQFATDPKLELEGRWTTIGPAATNHPDGTPDADTAPQVLVARSGNKRHGRIVSKLYDANRQLLDQKTDAANAKGEEITVESMAKAILLDWKNLAYQGEILPYSYENAKKLLAVKDFRALINKHAEAFAEYKLDQEVEDEKN